MTPAPRRGLRAGAALSLALGLALAFAPAGARAQARFEPVEPGRPGDAPMLFSLPPDAGFGRVAKPSPPLTPAQAARLRRAQDLRFAGLPERARDTLAVLEREVPHHPLIVAEQARIDLARGDYKSLVGRLTSERATLKDSLLASAELELGLERLARPREAAQVALETWVADGSRAGWALPLLVRLAPQGGRATLDAMRAAVTREPGRGDLVRGFALLLARAGQPAEAARALAAGETAQQRPRLRQWFADEVLFSGVRADSLAAYESLVSLAGEAAADAPTRAFSAQRALDLASRLGRDAEAPVRLGRALQDLPPDRMNSTLLLSLARALRESGHPAEAQALLGRAPANRQLPERALERALAILREGPPERAIAPLDSLARTWPRALFALADAEFYAGHADSAHVHYAKAAEDTDSPESMGALERAYLLEEQPGAPEVALFGQIAWERWRGNTARARTIADSLYRGVSLRSPFYAHAAIELSELRAAAKDLTGALAPLVVVADSLPADRLAPLARQRAGETLIALGDERRAVAQFEECLARYPRAWNAPEVRRRLEQLRRDRHL